MRDYFLTTDRIGFSVWTDADLELASSLWGNPTVSHFMNTTGHFSEEDIKARLQTETSNYQKYGLQYYPIFRLSDGLFLGCCGYCPHDLPNAVYELGCHLLPEFWGQGYAYEACKAAAEYGFREKPIKKILIRHHPKNIRSQHLIAHLGATPIGTTVYPPTGLNHPTYIILPTTKQ